ncbi:MAG: TIGR03118 family protein [Nibricoccus sp.]
MKNTCSPRLLSSRSSRRSTRVPVGFKKIGFALLALVSPAFIAQASAHDHPSGHYVQTNLVSDVAGLAAATDPHLVNPWGLSASATSPWWVADNGTGLSTLYNGAGAVQALVVTIPNLAGVADPSAPTGTVFNGTATDFLVAPGRPSRFLFSTEAGTIVGWSSGTTGVQMVNNAGSAVYKGLALAQIGGVNHLYAANFQTGKVDVFDRTFAPVTLSPWAFRDPHLPRGYAPFNVQAIGGSIYVAYAKTEAGSIEEVPGPGKGFVNIYSPEGVLQKRLQHGAWFNAPWGLAMAPADFGPFSNMILVGQFGSGKIAAFDPATGKFRGFLRGENHRPVKIEGLWAIAFGNGANAGPTNTLYFAAGIDDEAHGLFGSLTAVADPADDDDDHGHGHDRDHDDD